MSYSWTVDQNFSFRHSKLGRCMEIWLLLVSWQTFTLGKCGQHLVPMWDWLNLARYFSFSLFFINFFLTLHSLPSLYLSSVFYLFILSFFLFEPLMIDFGQLHPCTFYFHNYTVKHQGPKNMQKIMPQIFPVFFFLLLAGTLFIVT